MATYCWKNEDGTPGKPFDEKGYFAGDTYALSNTSTPVLMCLEDGWEYDATKELHDMVVEICADFDMIVDDVCFECEGDPLAEMEMAIHYAQFVDLGLWILRDDWSPKLMQNIMCR